MKPPILICFALPEEAAPFRAATQSRTDVEIVLTGIGRLNAHAALRAACVRKSPGFVLSCGFAGALRPGLAVGTVLFDADLEFPFAPALRTAGAVPARFLCADRILSTADEKRAAFQASGADAVDMESAAIREVCREQGIPAATVRAVSDAADEDMPLDFNRLMTATRRMHYGKLAGALLRSPAKVRSLLRLQRQCRTAAEALARVLLEVIPTRW